MPEFDTYVMRHGESWVQNIVERIERSENIRPGYCVSLEQRWNALMQQTVPVTYERIAA